jgi:gamma-glutamyltranspeptidase/glutathione hydrolase
VFTTRPDITGTFGAAAATHWLAAQTAMGVLERGGNAFDAAAAGGFVLQVVEPHLNGPAGEVPMLLWRAEGRRLQALNGQGPAPAEASPEAFRRLGLELVPGIGPLAATVPAAFAAWATLSREHGSWPLADVLAPAIGYARDGFPVSTRLAEAILGVRPLFLAHWPSSAAIWLDAGRVVLPGSTLRLPALASTYTRVLEEAEGRASGRTAVIDAAIDIWQRGFVAREIDAFSRREAVLDTSGEKHAGLLRADDMAAWRPTLEAPLTKPFGEVTVAKCGFWSQGPMSLQILGMLRHSGLDAHPPESAGFVHRIAEATKLAFADRLAWYGIAPGADREAQQALLGDDYAEARWAEVDLGRASRELRPGRPLGHAPRLPDLGVSERSLSDGEARHGTGEPTFGVLPPVGEWPDRELFVGDTCQIDVVDRHGNIVAATPSGGWLSSSPAIPALGFALGTRLQMTWFDPGLANTLTPRVAPCTTLSPTLVLRGDEPTLAFGTPGGDQQEQWQVAFWLRHALHGMSLQQAMDAPAFHVKHYPASFWPRRTLLNRLHVESRFPEATLAALRGLGHDVVVGDAWSEGRLCAVGRSRDREGKQIVHAAANPRFMQAYAVGR